MVYGLVAQQQESKATPDNKTHLGSLFSEGNGKMRRDINLHKQEWQKREGEQVLHFERECSTGV